MQCIINNQVVLSRVPDGPLAKHLGAFAQSRSAQGTPRSPFTGRFCLLQVSVIG